MCKVKNCFKCKNARVECGQIRCEKGFVPVWVNEPSKCKYTTYDYGDISQFRKNIKCV
jgi:hypothetical protein